jgi:hypothetical protein
MESREQLGTGGNVKNKQRVEKLRDPKPEIFTQAPFSSTFQP